MGDMATPDPHLIPQVTVLFAGQNIDKSPFGVNVGMALGDANKVMARGPGLEPVGNVANKPTYFDIYTAGGLWWPPHMEQGGSFLWLGARTWHGPVALRCGMDVLVLGDIEGIVLMVVWPWHGLLALTHPHDGKAMA